MKLSDLTKEELENMSYDDLAYGILSESKTQMKIIDLFNKIGSLVNLSEKEIEDKIADFFEMLTLDKRFIMLDDGSWDLKERHVQKIIIEEEEEDVGLEDIEESAEIEEEEEIFYDEEETDDSEDDLKDLVVIDEEEEDAL
ncbi:MAG: DNA-directed RNA polymerase subunit delta [Bacilli bacterium]|nr:DNA-directed RNA polymerase subunit delta [Bacilli bacterium]